MQDSSRLRIRKFIHSSREDDDDEDENDSQVEISDEDGGTATEVYELSQFYLTVPTPWKWKHEDENTKHEDENTKHEDEELTVLQATITTTTHNFLNYFNQSIGDVETEYNGKTELLEKGCDVTIFIDKGEKEDMADVSILFSNVKQEKDFGGQCIVSLIDLSNNPRFSESFIIPKKISFCMKKYLSLDRLLSDPLDLLPNGILTTRVELELKVYPKMEFFWNRENPLWRSYEDAFNNSFSMRYSDPSSYELKLCSSFGERLYEESKFFHCMLENKMLEKKYRTMVIEKNEQQAFFNIFILLMQIGFIEFPSISSIYDMYILAHKYDIPVVSEICIWFLKLLASIHRAYDLFSCINDYEEDVFKDILVTQLDDIYETKFDEDIIITDQIVSLKRPIRECFWSYAYYTNKTIFFDKNKQSTYISEIEKDEYDVSEKGEYDFYK